MQTLISGRIFFIMPLFNSAAGPFPDCKISREVPDSGFSFPTSGAYQFALKTSGTEKTVPKKLNNQEE
jgi:hypothetical protein